MKRITVYFHYDRHSRIDGCCLAMLRAVAACSDELIFVTNNRLTAEAASKVESLGARVYQRENIGFDVYAYREVLLAKGKTFFADVDELVLMNYTIAGPVHPLEQMFAEMARKPSLDFWGITRHYAMKSRRFNTQYGMVPTHLQSHFIAVRRRLLQSDDFWKYWQEMPLPKSYEDSVRLHEARFTRWFGDKGYTWDSYVDTEDLKEAFVNPIMACPLELMEKRGCPVFKRRNFFTPYGDELRRTDGSQALRLYVGLKRMQFPVDSLLASLVQSQPLQAVSMAMHWDAVLLPEAASRQSVTVLQADASGQIAKDALDGLEPDALVLIVQVPQGLSAVGQWYAKQTVVDLCDEAQPNRPLHQAAALFEQDENLAMLSFAPGQYPGWAQWQQAQWDIALPALQSQAETLGLAPLEDAKAALPLPAPWMGTVLVRRRTLGQAIPTTQLAWWQLALQQAAEGRHCVAVCDATALRTATTNQAIAATDAESARAMLKQTLRAVKHKLGGKGKP